MFEPENPAYHSNSPIDLHLEQFRLSRGDSSFFWPIGTANPQEGTAIEFELLDLSAAIQSREKDALEFLGHYYPLFCQAFPEPDSRSLLDECVRDLKQPNFFLQVAISNGQIIGGVHWWLLEVPDPAAGSSHCQFLTQGKSSSKPLLLGVEEHIWVDRSLRGCGVGKALDSNLKAQLRELGADALISEIKNPFFMEPHDRQLDLAIGQDPEARLRFFQGRGRQLIDAPYTQPALRPNAAPLDGMALTIEPLVLGFSGITGAQYLAFLKEYFSKILGSSSVESDPTFVRIREKMAGLKYSRVEFVPLDRQHLEFNQ